MENNFSPTENNFSTNEPVIDGAMQDVHDQTYRINELCRLGGPVDWQNYGEKEKATGIPAIYFARNNARPNLNRVEVKPGTITPKIAKVIEALPDYEAVPLALDPAVIKKIEQDVTNQEFYDAVLAAQSPNGHKGGGFHAAVLKKAATENPGQYQQRLASILKSVNGMDDAEAQAQSRILLQVFSHKPTDGEQALLKGIFLDMREGKSVEEIVSDPEYGKNPYLRRMAELYADHQRKAAIGALMLAKQIYGAEEWKGFSSDQKKTALATMENRYPGFEWLSDVPVNLVDNIGAFDNIDQKVASAANFFGAVDLGTAIIKRMNPYDDADPRLLSSGQLHANRAYQREILNALRPSTWGDKIISATAATIPFVYEMGMSGGAPGANGVIKNLPRLLADPKGYLAGTAKLFGLNALHGIKSPVFIAKNIIQAAADTIENESTQPVVVFDPQSGTNLVVNDADAENLFGKFAGAFGKHMISNSISVGVEGLGEAFDVALPLGAKKYVLNRIFGNASPKVLARFSDGLRRFGIQSFPAELIEEMVEDPLQASKDWLFENTGLDVLSTHQESQLLHDPVEFFKTTPVVLAAMRLPANVSAVMASIGDYNRAKIAAAMVDGRITDYPSNLAPDVGDKDQNPISGQAQKTWGQVRNLFVYTPKCATDRIMETADPKIAEQVKTIIHEDDAGMQAISTNEAREFVRNHPETKQLVLDVLHCGVQSSFYEHTLTPEDIKNALNVTAERADVLANIATTIRDAVEQMPDSPERRKATASSNLAFVQLVTSYSNILLGRDFDALPPDAKKARTDEVMKAVSGMTIAAVNSNDLGTPVEDIKGVTVADVYANSSAARSAVIAFSNATGMDMSPSIYRAAEAALSFIEEKGNSEDSELALYNSIADMLERQLSDGQTLTIGDTQIRIREIKGDEADSPSQFQCEIASKGLPIERLDPADTYDKALEEAANAPSVRDRIANKLIDATDETKKLKGALSTTAYGALHGDAATLANGDNITIRNADNIISLRAMKPTYRALLRAYLMRQAGASPEEVYQKTMWIGSAYGHWQFAVPPVLLSDAAIEQLATGNGQVRLSDIVPEDSPLLNLHPELANMMVPVFSGDVLADQNAVPLEESTIKTKAMAAMEGDATAKAELNGIVYSSIADVIETREGLDDGTVPRVAPDLVELNKYVLADVKEGSQIGNRNSTEIDRQLIRAFDIPAEFQKTPAEYVLRLANERGGIDALLSSDFELPGARPPHLKGLTTFSENGGLMNDYSTLIMLFKGADTSTMVHETGHWMYRVLKQFAKSGVASRDLLDAVAAIDAHLAEYARSKGAIEGTNEWESRCHEAFAEVFVKYLLTADAPPLIDGALSQVRKQLQNTYRYLKTNSDVSLSPEIDSFFGSMMAVEDMFNNGEAPLSALMDAGALRQFLMDNSGALDVSSAEIEKLCQLLDVARDSQVAVAGREARDSIDEGALDAEANEAYDLSLHPRIDKALANIGGVPFDAVMDALPDEIDGIPKEEIRRKLYQIAHKHGWIYVPHEAHERMRGVREEYAGNKLAEESLRREHESLAKAVEAAETTLQATEGKLAQMVGNRTEKVEVAKTDVAILQGQEKSLHRRYDEAYTKQVQAANMQDAAEKKMATVRGQSKQLRDELGEKVKEAQAGVNDARKELSNAESNLTATQRRLNIVQRRVDNLRTRLDAAKEKYKELIDKSQLARVEDSEAVAIVAEERDFYDAAIKELHNNVAEQDRLDRRLQTLNKKHIELVERLGGAQARQAGFDKKLQIRRQIVEKVKSGKHELRDIERAERGIELEAKRISVSSQQLFEVEKEIDDATKRLEHLIDTFGESHQNLIGSDASLKRAELTRGRKREAVEKLSDRKRMAHAYVIALRDALAEAKEQLKWTRQSLAWVQTEEQKANGDWDATRAVNRYDNARARVEQAKKNLEKAIQKRDEMRAIRNAPETYARFNDELATLSREQASAAIMHGEAKREADETQRERKRNRDKVMQLQKQIARMETEIAEAKNKYGAAMDMAKLMLREAISRRDDVFARLLKQEAETKQLRNRISGYVPAAEREGNATQQSEDASVDFKNSPLAEQFREEESAKQLSKIEEAMRNNDFPVTSLTSLARAIAQFASRHQYVTDYKNRLRQEIIENPDMSLRMKTLDSDRLNEVFDRFTMLFKTFAPMYTRSHRRRLNVASAQARIDNSTVKAIMHNKVDAGGENGEIRLYDGIRSEAKNIMFALTEVAKHFGELRKDGKMTAIALRKAAQASGALDSINRLIQEVAIAKRLNHAQGIISRFAKQLRISRINKMQGRIDGDALYALREIQQAVSGELTSIVPNTPKTPGNVGKNWRRLFVEQINAMVQECNGEPRQWEEFCYSDNIDIESLTVAQLQELSDFYSCIKHFGKMMVDKASQDSREHIEHTVNKIIEEITPDADKHNHSALPTQEEGGAPFWRRALDSAMTLDSMSKLLYRFMTEHGGALAGLYNRLTEMRHDEDALKALCYDGQFGLNQTLKNIETMAMNQNIDVSALDNSEVAFRASNDPYSYRHWTVHEAIMATLYLGTDSGRQRLRRTILSDPKLTEQQIMEILPDEVLEQIPAALPAELLTEINSIWRILDNTINPSVRDTYRKQYGVDLELLPAVPFSVNGVQMSGGYIPLAYRYSAAAYKSFKGNGDYGKGTDIDLFERGKAYTPQTSSIHKRQQALPDPPPLSLNLNVIKHYTDESAHYATFALGMGYILKVIRNKTFKNTYERAYGVHDYDAMEKTILQISAPDKFLNPVNAFERTAKGVMVARALWGNLTSVMKQFPSITIGAHEIGRGRLLGAMANWLAHPLEADRWARDMSPYLRDRAHHIDNDISNTINNLFEIKTVKAWKSAKWIGFAPMTYCDRVVASIGFKAAYDKALSEGKTIYEAVAYAEDFVKRTQGSAEAMYNPQLKNHPVGRACTVFMTAAIAAYNMARHDVAMSSKKGIKATLLSLLDDVLMPSIICAIITFLHTPGGEDEKDESIMNKRLGAAATEFGQTVWGGVPGANLVLDTVQSMYTETGYGKISRLPWFEPYDEVTRSASKAVSLAVGGQYTASALNLLNAVSIMGEVPVVKFGERMAKYSKAYGLTDPDEKPWTLREFTREAEKETR